MTYALHEFFDLDRVSDLIPTFDSQTLFSPGCGQHMKISADPLPNVCPRYLVVPKVPYCQSHYFTPLLSTRASTTPPLPSLGFSTSSSNNIRPGHINGNTKKGKGAFPAPHSNVLIGLSLFKKPLLPFDIKLCWPRPNVTMVTEFHQPTWFG